MGSYCIECGVELEPGASFCSSCGAEVDNSPQGGQTATDPATESATASRSAPPRWSLVVLGGLWVVGLAGFLSGTNAGYALVTFSVLPSLPLLWWDARAAKRAGQLEISHPVFVPIAILLLWLLTLPAYLLFRTTKSTDTPGETGAVEA